MTARARDGVVEPEGHATDAVRQVEHWYKECVDGFVQEGRTQAVMVVSEASTHPGTITGSVLAFAHEHAWRHAIVRAARSSHPTDWAAMTVVHEAAAYEHLLGWTAATYGVPEDDVRAFQTSRGYRHHSR